jgi:hypothetical protein
MWVSCIQLVHPPTVRGLAVCAASPMITTLDRTTVSAANSHTGCAVTFPVEA